MTKLMLAIMTFAISFTAPLNPETSTVAKKSKIQVAICLDTSNSMDGLIDQAKSQLWKMVNELASSKKEGKTPEIELALFEYGNSRLSVEQGYIRQVSPLTTDLDLISEKLFGLTTRGGDEYCGWTIQEATQGLNWSSNNDDLKLIIIAGNEPFNQGKVDYKIACKNAIAKGIMVNTIHCGNYEEGVRTFWKDGAELTDGKYMNINQDERVVHIPTPYDDDILKLNNQLNDTYIGYGRLGKSRKEMQLRQDANAMSYGEANNVERAVSKSNRAYNNTTWDLVDAMAEDENVLETLDKDQLPEEMKKMSKKEQKAFVTEKAKQRVEIQEKINQLNTKRQEFIAQKQAKDKAALTLDNVMMKTVREQAEKKNYKF